MILILDLLKGGAARPCIVWAELIETNVWVLSWLLPDGTSEILEMTRLEFDRAIGLSGNIEQ